jgi:hypothetical protein
MKLLNSFMGASFRLQLVSEKPNCARLDAPTFSSPVSSSSQAFSAPGVSSAVGLVGAEFALRHSSHQTGAVFFVPAVSFHFSKGY